MNQEGDTTELSNSTKSLESNAELQTHQQWREEQCQNKLPSPVEHACEGHGHRSARLVKQFSSNEPGDWPRAQLIG